MAPSSGKKALIFQGARMASQAMSEEDFAMFLFELCTLWCGQKPGLNCKWIAMTCTLERRLTLVDALRSQRLGARLLAFPLCSAHTRDCKWLSGNRRSELSTFLTLWLSLTSMSNFSSGFRCSDGPFRSVYARSPKTRGEKLVIWRRPWQRLVVCVSDSSWEDVERLPETFFELLNLQGRALNEFTCVTWFLIVYNL